MEVDPFINRDCGDYLKPHKDGVQYINETTKQPQQLRIKTTLEITHLFFPFLWHHMRKAQSSTYCSKLDTLDIKYSSIYSVKKQKKAAFSQVCRLVWWWWCKDLWKRTDPGSLLRENKSEGGHNKNHRMVKNLAEKQINKLKSIGRPIFSLLSCSSNCCQTVDFSITCWVSEQTVEIWKHSKWVWS